MKDYESKLYKTIGQALKDMEANQDWHVVSVYATGWREYVRVVYYIEKDVTTTDAQYLDKALDFIVESEKDNDYICTMLHEIPEEYEVCANDCQNLNRNCVLRFLKRYKG